LSRIEIENLEVNKLIKEFPPFFENGGFSKTGSVEPCYEQIDSIQTPDAG